MPRGSRFPQFHIVVSEISGILTSLEILLDLRATMGLVASRGEYPDGAEFIRNLNGHA